MIDTIIIHHSDSPHGRGDNAETIHGWHTLRKFSGIGYHAVILEDGTIEYGRPDYWEGAHAAGYNANSLGVCLIGKDYFTDHQFDALANYLYTKVDKYNIPLENIYGHCEVSTKTCPNFDVDAFKEAYGLYEVPNV